MAKNKANNNEEYEEIGEYMVNEKSMRRMVISSYSKGGFSIAQKCKSFYNDGDIFLKGSYHVDTTEELRKIGKFITSVANKIDNVTKENKTKEK